jgi:phospholipase/carboxylesterase
MGFIIQHTAAPSRCPKESLQPVHEGHAMDEPIAVWRRPAKRGPATPLVVLLHGRGADEHDLIDLAGELPRSYAYVSLRGPLALPEGGYRWFEDRGVARPIGKSLHAAVAGVRAFTDAPQAAEYDRARTYLLGFSAGMMLAGADARRSGPLRGRGFAERRDRARHR